jgi:hypothetical protein
MTLTVMALLYIGKMRLRRKRHPSLGGIPPHRQAVVHQESPVTQKALGRRGPAQALRETSHRELSSRAESELQVSSAGR